MSLNDTVVDVSPESQRRALRRSVPSFFTRVTELGTAAQASIPGLYAWAVTVAPAAFGKGGGAFSKVLSIVALLALAAGLCLERRYPRYARIGSIWGFTVSSALVWASAPASLTPLHLEATRGLAGMLGWALFAFASAAPAIPREPSTDRIIEGAPLRPRARMPKGDTLVMALGALIACSLQAIGWQTAVPERAVLVRLVCLATGLSVLGAATTIALARHTRRIPAPTRMRVRDALPWLVLFGVLVAAGIAIQFFVK